MPLLRLISLALPCKRLYLQLALVCLAGSFSINTCASEQKGNIRLALSGDATRVSIDDDIDVSGKSMNAIYRALDMTSHNSYRVPLAEADIKANPILKAFTQLRRKDKNRSESRSNAVIIGQGDCHLLLSTSGHSLLDTEYNSLTTPRQVEVKLNKVWTRALELSAPQNLSSQSDEWQDWGLIIVKKPRCTPYPSTKTRAFNKTELKACQARVQLACFHPDRPQYRKQLQLEQGCSLLISNKPAVQSSPNIGKENWAGYFSCKQSQGASGCAPLCELNGELRNMGVLSKSLQGREETVIPQRVGAFRVVSGDYYQAILQLANKYDIRL